MTREEKLSAALDEIRQRVERTMCPTFSSDAGDIGENGRISRRDFDTLILAALSTPKVEAVERADQSGCAFNGDHLAWAVSRWKAEVENRPLHNVHRRTLDDTWRQVIRRLGGAPGDLLPMADHDTLLDARGGHSG